VNLGPVNEKHASVSHLRHNLTLFVTCLSVRKFESSLSATALNDTSMPRV